MGKLKRQGVSAVARFFRKASGKIIAGLAIAFAVAMLARPTSAWFLDSASAPVAAQSDGIVRNAIAAGGTGFQISCEIANASKLPDKLYPGETLEAVLKFSNLNSAPAVYRIKPGLKGVDMIVDQSAEGFETLLEIGEPLAKSEAQGAYYGCLAASSIVYVRVMLKMKGEELDIPLNYEPSSDGKLTLEIDSCQADPAAAKDLFGLDMDFSTGKAVILG
jgi:hypothetical protein